MDGATDGGAAFGIGGKFPDFGACVVLAAAAVGHAGVLAAGFAAGTCRAAGVGCAAGVAGFAALSGFGADFGGAGAGAAACGAGAAAGAPGLAGSPLRSSPRATRKVPLACSIFMGLVRTRLAPIRNAFATPA